MRSTGWPGQSSGRKSPALLDHLRERARHLKEERRPLLCLGLPEQPGAPVPKCAGQMGDLQVTPGNGTWAADSRHRTKGLSGGPQGLSGLSMPKPSRLGLAVGP
jgi:hypothetical protein